MSDGSNKEFRRKKKGKDKVGEMGASMKKDREEEGKREASRSLEEKKKENVTAKRYREEGTR